MCTTLLTEINFKSGILTYAILYFVLLSKNIDKLQFVWRLAVMNLGLLPMYICFTQSSKLNSIS